MQNAVVFDANYNAVAKYEPNDSPIMAIMQGVPGSGKSTLANRITEPQNIVGNDEFLQDRKYMGFIKNARGVKIIYNIKNMFK